MSHKEDESQIQHAYIGDGIYAEHDGFCLRLYTQSGNNIWFEPDHWIKLEEFMEKCHVA